jgi:hypothetical protein
MYESIYQPPPQEDPGCNNPQEAEETPWLHHRAHIGCPYHQGSIERIATVPNKGIPEWQEWFMYRELFANATSDNTDPNVMDEVREFYLTQMTNRVTETNPPYAPVKTREEALNNAALITRTQIMLCLITAALVLLPILVNVL